MDKRGCFTSQRDSVGGARERARSLRRIFVKIFFKDAISVEQWLQDEKVYTKVTVNKITHVFSSPEAYADTNKSFTMFYPPLHTVHQTALRVEREEAACISQTKSEEEERVGDFCRVSLINVDANVLSKEVLCVFLLRAVQRFTS